MSRATILVLLGLVTLIAFGQSTCPLARTDWRCGSGYGNSPCFAGYCCSQYGYCGDSSDHCNALSQNVTCVPSLAPTLAPTQPPTTAPTLAPTTASPTTSCPVARTDWRCGSGFGNAPCLPGYCCSQYGYCGDSTQHCNQNSQVINCSSPTPAPTTAAPTTAAPTTAAPTTAAPTTAAPTTAAPTTTSAPTTSAPTIAPTTASPTTTCPAARTDWRCGTEFGNAPCLPGYCCSQYGYCGDSTNHCNANSQTIACGLTYAATEYCGEKMIALTFDDGPNFATSAVLDVLDSRKVKATLFVNGDNWPSTTASKCSLLQRAVSLGIEIESHSFAHGNFHNHNMDTTITDLKLLESFLKSCGILTPVKFFRPPFGNLYKAQAEEMYKQLGYVVSFWNSKTDDGGVVTAEQAIASLQATMPSPESGQGALVLLHDIAIQNSLGAVITWLNTTYSPYGYRFVTQQECWDGCTNWNTGVTGRICKYPGSTHYQLGAW